MLNIIFLALLGCKAELEIEKNAPGTDSATEALPPIAYGIDYIEDVCKHDDIGEKVCDFKFDDHNDNPWRLYEHEGKIVVLDFSAAWCGPCQSAGYYAQPIQDDYAGDVVFVTLLLAGTQNLPTTLEDAQTWAADHGNISAPVLQSSAEQVMDPNGIEGYVIPGLPTYIYLNQDLEIHLGHVGFSEQYMRDTIDGLLNVESI